jgi:hypothetical protein
MNITLPSDFKNFLGLLNENRVEYLLISNYAVGYQKYPCARKDIDIWIAVNPEIASWR